MNNELYIITHGEWRPMAEARHATLTVTVEVCNATGASGTPTASTCNVRVLQ